MNFEDGKLMPGIEKRIVYRDWERFVVSRFAFKLFTDKLYKHLIYHCAFIAHYNKVGFFSYYFMEDNQRKIAFIEQFVSGRSVEYGDMTWLTGDDYRDINTAMMELMQKYSDKLKSELNEAVFKEDMEKIKSIMDKHRLCAITYREEKFSFEKRQ